MRYVATAMCRASEKDPDVRTVKLRVGSLDEAITALVGIAGKKKIEDVYQLEIHLSDTGSGVTSVYTHGPDIMADLPVNVPVAIATSTSAPPVTPAQPLKVTTVVEATLSIKRNHSPIVRKKVGAAPWFLTSIQQ